MPGDALPEPELSHEPDLGLNDLAHQEVVLALPAQIQLPQNEALPVVEPLQPNQDVLPILNPIENIHPPLEEQHQQEPPSRIRNQMPTMQIVQTLSI